MRETERLDIKLSADGVAIETGPGVKCEIGKPGEFADVDLEEPASALFGAECSRTVAKPGELEAGGAIGGDFSTVEFPAHAIDDANGKLDHIAAGDLKRHLRFDGEGLHGFDVADAGAERAVLGEAVGQDSE